MLKKLCNDILKEDITVIASRPANGKVQMILNIIHELGMKQKKKIMMFGLEDPINWYEKKLVSLMSGIDEFEIENYFHPCNIYQKPFKVKSQFIKALEQLGHSKIHMCELCFRNFSIDILDYMLNYDEEKNVDVIIIDSLDSIVEQSNYKIFKLLEKIKSYAKKYHTHFIILSKVDRKAETRKIQKIEDINYYKTLKLYVDIIMLVYRLQENNLYINHLELLLNKGNKQETYQIFYNIKTNRVE